MAMTVAANSLVRERVRTSRSTSYRLRLTGEFQLLAGVSAIVLPHSAERVVAFLGVSGQPVTRWRVAGSLWPDVPEERAQGDLRSALWRLRSVAPIVRADESRLAFTDNVGIDVAELTSLSSQILEGSGRDGRDRLAELVAGREILPGWDEDWLVVERERYRAIRLHALERAGENLLKVGDLAAALQAGLAAVSTEPFRESAHRLLVRVHLAEGNLAEAARAYRSYRSLMAEELGIGPSPLMEEIAGPFLRDSTFRPPRDGRLTGA